MYRNLNHKKQDLSFILLHMFCDKTYASIKQEKETVLAYPIILHPVIFNRTFGTSVITIY